MRSQEVAHWTKTSAAITRPVAPAREHQSRGAFDYYLASKAQLCVALEDGAVPPARGRILEHDLARAIVSCLPDVVAERLAIATDWSGWT